jgi:hypothetical protein
LLRDTPNDDDGDDAGEDVYADGDMEEYNCAADKDEDEDGGGDDDDDNDDDDDDDDKDSDDEDNGNDDDDADDDDDNGNDDDGDDGSTPDGPLAPAGHPGGAQARYDPPMEEGEGSICKRKRITGLVLQ